MAVDWDKAQQKAARTRRWAVTMTKVRIRRIASRTQWQLVTFCGKAGGESVGVVDLLAVRKDHGKRAAGAKRGDALQLILIQVKGGTAARPTAEDAARLRAVARRHRAHHVLLATWRKGSGSIVCGIRLRKRRGGKSWTLRRCSAESATTELFSKSASKSLISCYLAKVDHFVDINKMARRSFLGVHRRLKRNLRVVPTLMAIKQLLVRQSFTGKRSAGRGSGGSGLVLIATCGRAGA